MCFIYERIRIKKIIEYKDNIALIMFLRKQKGKRNKIINILDNEIMLMIDKRNNIYDSLKQCSIENTKSVYLFIEMLLNNGYDKLYQILINSFSLGEVTNKTEGEYVFKHFEIVNKDYKYIFERDEDDSDKIRKQIISYE